MMKNSFSVLSLILVNVILAVAGQTVAKLGVQKIGIFTSMPLTTFVFKSFLSPWIISGLFLYLLSAVIWFMVLSETELSVAYPTLSIGYILVLLIGYFFLGETLTLAKCFGVFFICLGIYIIFR